MSYGHAARRLDPDTRRRDIMRTLWALLAISALVLAGCSTGGSSGFSTPATVKVVYELDGTASSADITIQTDNGGTSQQQAVDVPLRNRNGGRGLRFTFLAGDFVYISAQNNGTGDLTCRIKADGRVVSENTATGEYAIATCEGRA